MATIEIKVPDIGGYDGVPVIEVLVKVGDTVTLDQGLVTLESDKATMEVPSTVAGVVKAMRVKLGDAVSEGHVIAEIESAAAVALPGAVAATPVAPPLAAQAASGEDDLRSEDRRVSGVVPATDGSDERGTGVERRASTAHPPSGRKADHTTQLAVLGAGPGGYSAAFRAADLGLDVILIERYAELGGVCLNVGCIPSKALLHAAEVIDQAAHASAYGVEFGAPRITLDKLRDHKKKVVGQLTKGLAGMAKQRKVRVLTGHARFLSPFELAVKSDSGEVVVKFDKAIIAVGSQPVKLPGFPWHDARIMDSTDALELAEIPKSLLVVGGGIIGLEMATVFRALGSQVTVVEMADQLMPGSDPDLVKPLADRLTAQGVAIHLATKATKVDVATQGITVAFEGTKAPDPQTFDRVLVSVGRVPNGGRIDAVSAGVEVDARGYIAADGQLRTNVPHIFAIGDVIGQPMLAHKATHEAHVAAEVAAGHKRAFDARVIPSVAYTDPEIAWIGVTETEARAKGIKIGVGKFPWAASGRAIGIGRTEGFTKLIFDEASHRIIGAGIVGVHAGDLIAELALAIEMGCEAADIAHTIHPHPTLSESIGMAAEVFEGTITDLYIPKKKP